MTIPLCCGEHAASRLNGSSTCPANRRFGFELMNAARGQLNLQKSFPESETRRSFGCDAADAIGSRIVPPAPQRVSFAGRRGTCGCCRLTISEKNASNRTTSVDNVVTAA